VRKKIGSWQPPSSFFFCSPFRCRFVACRLSSVSTFARAKIHLSVTPRTSSQRHRQERDPSSSMRSKKSPLVAGKVSRHEREKNQLSSEETSTEASRSRKIEIVRASFFFFLLLFSSSLSSSKQQQLSLHQRSSKPPDTPFHRNSKTRAILKQSFYKLFLAFQKATGKHSSV